MYAALLCRGCTPVEATHAADGRHQALLEEDDLGTAELGQHRAQQARITAALVAAHDLQVNGEPTRVDTCCGYDDLAGCGVRSDAEANGARALFRLERDELGVGGRRDRK